MHLKVNSLFSFTLRIILVTWFITCSLLGQSAPVRTINGVSVPGDFPNIEVHHYSNDTAPGKIFFGSTFTNSDKGNYLVILKNDGTPYFYKRFDKNSDGRGSGEFQRQPGNLLTAYLFEPRLYIAFDSTFAIIDTFQCKNGYPTNAHEMVLTPEGHALLIADEYKHVDMSQLVDGGHSNARVLGNHIQELDENKNVVFEWKCWDHFDITDAVHENLQSSRIDYVHMNSIAVDYDGHLIISSRHLDEITKINRQTGEIIWRLGGRRNQFEFVNDPYRFSYQHYARPVPGKPDSYTLFDNGNHRQPKFSRAVEYTLDTDAMTAEKTWEFRYTPDRYSSMMGNVQRLDNGNTMINWSNWPPLFANEVDADGNVLFELIAHGTSSNRVRRYEWQGVALTPYLIAESRHDGVLLIFNKFGDEAVRDYIIYGGRSPDTMTPMDTTANTYTHLTRLESGANYYFKVCAVDSLGRKSEFSNQESIFFKRAVPGENLVINGDFSDSDRNWTFLERDKARAVGRADDGVFTIDIEKGGSEYWNVQLVQKNIPLVQGHTYLFEFDAWADAPRIIEAKLAQDGSPWRNYSKTSPMAIKRGRNRYAFEFEMVSATDDKARVVINCGTSDIDCYFDNISVTEIVESEVSQSISKPVKKNLVSRNYPNPFNPNTTIQFEIFENGFVTIKIFDLTGKHVKTLLQANQLAGVHTVNWDGTNKNNHSVAAGVYFYQIEFICSNSERKVSMEKMSLVR